MFKIKEMRLDLVKNEDYLLALSEDEPTKLGEYCYGEDINKEWKVTLHQAGSNDIAVTGFSKKVIGYLPLLKTTKELKNVALLPNFDTDIVEENFKGLRDCIEDQDIAEFYISLVRTLLETYKYTDEDIKNAFISGSNIDIKTCSDGIKNNLGGFIKTIREAKYPIVFECDEYGIGNDENNRPVIEPRVITNNHGKTELVGYYRY